MDLFNQASKRIAQENNVPFVDIESQVPKTDRYLTDDVHYTDAGDKKVADIIYKAILDSSYLNQ
jgi:lysophospholipase L1-like esterase